MLFFMPMVPPTSTGQMRKFRVVGGKVQSYKPDKVKETEELLLAALAPFAPSEPLTGPIGLEVQWQFYSKSHKPATWRTTRPDTDNLQKLLKDCMTRLGFWQDDSQVVQEHIHKCWVEEGAQGIGVELFTPAAPIHWQEVMEFAKSYE